MKIKSRKGEITLLGIITIAVVAAILMCGGVAAIKIYTFPWWGFGISVIVAVSIVLYIFKKIGSK